MTMAYLGRSALVREAGRDSLNLVPNLVRDPVSFDAPLLLPVRFREAICALHDVVISDLKFHRRDRTAYLEWKKGERAREAGLRAEALKDAKAQILARRGDVPADFEADYARCRSRYWRARQKYAEYLSKNDPALWRALMPCDPIVTVAPDVVFFEGFSTDESSYGCLSVNREDGFGRSDVTLCGTTNVDFSWELYHHFQELRSYRESRLRVDPAGFEVATQGRADYREEKIDLPAGWLRGFLHLQAAMGFPARRVTLTREAVYSLLAWLRRHRARTGPRAIRFELVQGRPPRLVLEPWEREIVAHGAVHEGASIPPVRIWGRQRLLSLARLLPLAERFDVHLLGTGFPSFWVAHMGEMRFTLGLSGWTSNDWTRGSALDLLAPPVDPPAALVKNVAALVREKRAATLAAIRTEILAGPAECAAALARLASTGQVIHDLPAGVVRWRQVMSMELGEEQLGPENEELAGSRRLVAERRVTLDTFRDASPAGRLYTGRVGTTEVELLLDADGRLKRGTCGCSHHRRSGLRAGPCRHLLALRRVALEGPPGPEGGGWTSWFQPIATWAIM